MKDKNLAQLAEVAERLQELSEEVVFLGGTTVALFITDAAAPDICQTVDVDCMADVTSLQQYHAFAKRLGEKGFYQRMDEPVICRWFCDALTLDVMVTDESILGFANRWAKSALQNASLVALANGTSVNVVSPVYFIATKLEAFKGRGKRDYLSSHDLEDIIAVLDGRPEIFAEIANASTDVQSYIIGEFEALLAEPRFLEALPGHLSYGGATQERLTALLDNLNQLTCPAN